MHCQAWQEQSTRPSSKSQYVVRSRRSNEAHKAKVCDLFFVHQRGSLNGLYLTVVMIGNYLGPVAASYVAVGKRVSSSTLEKLNVGRCKVSERAEV